MVSIPASELKRYAEAFKTMIGDEVIIQDDGYYVFWPSGNTAYSAAFLQFIADEISELNYNIIVMDNEGY